MSFLKPKTKLLLAVDISASSAKAVLFWSHKNAKPEIAKYFASNSKFLPEADFAKLRKSALQSFHDVVKQARSSTNDKISGIFLSLSSPWYFSQTRVINIKSRDPFEITPDFLDSALKKEEDALKQKSEERFKISGKDLVVLERHPQKSFLNGYGVKDVFGKKTASAEIHVYMSVAQKDMLDSLKDIVKNEIGADVHIHTSPLIVFKVLQDRFNIEKGFLLVNIGEEITDVAFIHKGYTEEVLSFARGGNFIIRRIASLFKIDLQEAESYLKMHHNGKLEDKAAAKIKEVIKDASGEWASFFQKTLEHFYEISPVSEDTFILGSSPAINEFAEVMKDENMSRFTVSATPLNPTIVLPVMFKDQMHFTGPLKTYQDSVLLLSTLFFNNHNNYVWEKE